MLIRLGESAPSSLSTVDLRHLGGAIADIPPDTTAFWHRKRPFMVTVEASWEDPAAMLFGGNYERPVAVETTFDPGNRFSYNLNVEPRTGQP
ncbi:BBE domain-containing protein [Haloarchaeobius sp. TZWWS8]|uniref:BBE domain-containing protein n=1 Tax=Haloarchaeobius sp. TZWWS8 TaxID=3446121 RepID=UPI003EC05FE9